mgnify:CR=1 FL=1|jgi:hypothetical protein|tara:strand:- start:71 stop:421 length:351 start_codon:yes stop_codon:yes gene_type:complete
MSNPSLTHTTEKHAQPYVWPIGQNPEEVLMLAVVSVAKRDYRLLSDNGRIIDGHVADPWPLHNNERGATNLTHYRSKIEVQNLIDFFRGDGVHSALRAAGCEIHPRVLREEMGIAV